MRDEFRRISPEGSSLRSLNLADRALDGRQRGLQHVQQSLAFVCQRHVPGRAG